MDTLFMHRVNVQAPALMRFANWPKGVCRKPNSAQSGKELFSECREQVATRRRGDYAAIRAVQEVVDLRIVAAIEQLCTQTRGRQYNASDPFVCISSGDLRIAIARRRRVEVMGASVQAIQWNAGGIVWRPHRPTHSFP